MAKDSEVFSYCIGRPFPTSETKISVYFFGTEVHHGTIEDAEAMRRCADVSSGRQNFIYRLVKTDAENKDGS